MKKYIVINIGEGYFDCKEIDSPSIIRIIPYLHMELKIKQEVMDDKKVTTIVM